MPTYTRRYSLAGDKYFQPLCANEMLLETTRNMANGCPICLSPYRPSTIDDPCGAFSYLKTSPSDVVKIPLSWKVTVTHGLTLLVPFVNHIGFAAGMTTQPLLEGLGGTSFPMRGVEFDQVYEWTSPWMALGPRRSHYKHTLSNGWIHERTVIDDVMVELKFLMMKYPPCQSGWTLTLRRSRTTDDFQSYAGPGYPTGGGFGAALPTTSDNYKNFTALPAQWEQILHPNNAYLTPTPRPLSERFPFMGNYSNTSGGFYAEMPGNDNTHSPWHVKHAPSLLLVFSGVTFLHEVEIEKVAIGDAGDWSGTISISPQIYFGETPVAGAGNAKYAAAMLTMEEL